jgi:hypothetical protein
VNDEKWIRVGSFIGPEQPPARAPDERPPLEPTEEVPYPYEQFATMTLLATLTSLRVTQVIHGPTDRTRSIERALVAELERRGEHNA